MTWGWVRVKFANFPRKKVLLKWRTCEFSCVKSWFEFPKALLCHWTNFKKQDGKLFPRYHNLTYHKGSFGHILLKYQLYDLLLVCTQICIHLPCYWMVKFIFHFRGSLSYTCGRFSGNIVNLFVQKRIPSILQIHYCHQ